MYCTGCGTLLGQAVTARPAAPARDPPDPRAPLALVRGDQLLATAHRR